MKRIPLAALLTALFCAAPAFAGDQAVTYPFDGDFDDATFALESAILDRGLVIDYVSHTGEMLERTKGDVGSDVTLFTNADIFLFCSASLSRKVMEADPMNIAHCPYAIFAAERDGTVFLGHRTYPDGPMQEIEALLKSIAENAAE